MGLLLNIAVASGLARIGSLMENDRASNPPLSLHAHPEEFFVGNISKELARRLGKTKPTRVQREIVEMAMGIPTPTHWLEFVFLAYHHHQFDAIFLTGRPDVKGSLPHAD